MSKAFEKKLDFWIEHNLNVLVEGSHGTGKTTLIQEAMERAGLKWRYFSAATMDPWVDFVGLPKEKVHADGTSTLQLIRPEEFMDGSIQVLFFDEFNRSQKKVRNAVMELLQYKSINGKEIPGLRMVWAAINPTDENETYDVEELDPAQKDRFHIQTSIPSVPDRPFFIREFGEHIGNRAVEWWLSLPEASQELVSPRRLEYAVDIFKKGGDLRDVLDRRVLPLTLKQQIERVSASESHADRWLSDPELYISEVSNRQKGNPIDPVEAFAELKHISMESAVTYLSRLPANKINDVAADNRTVGIVLRALRDNRTSRQLLTALTRQAVNHTYASDDAMTRLKNIKETDRPLYAATAACTSQAVSIQAEIWNRLCSLVEQRMDESLLEYDDCAMLLVVFADDEMAATNPNCQRVAKNLIEYVENSHANQFLDFVRLRPAFVARVY